MYLYFVIHLNFGVIVKYQYLVYFCHVSIYCSFTSNNPNSVIFYFLDVSIYCVLSSSFLISSIFLFVNVKIKATQCDSLPPYLQFDRVCVGAFPSMSINSHRVFYENGIQPKKQVGMSAGLFAAMLFVAPQAMMEYPTHEAKADKFLPSHTNCQTMHELNVSIAGLGDSQPDRQTFYRKNKASLAHVIQHMAFVLTANSSSFTEEIPATYLRAPSDELMQRFDEEGTELSTLENPNFPEVHYIAFKRVYANNIFILHQHLLTDFPDHLALSRPTFHDLESPPARAWSNIHKRMILRIVKHGVYGAWGEIPDGDNSTNKFAGPLLATEFFLVWPFLVGTITNMKKARRDSFRKALKGTTEKVVRDLVRHFQLHKLHYPINMTKNKPLLKMADIKDDEIKQMKKSMCAEMGKRMAKSRKRVRRYNKGKDKPLPVPLRHQYIAKDDEILG